MKKNEHPIQIYEFRDMFQFFILLYITFGIALHC